MDLGPLIPALLPGIMVGLIAFFAKNKLQSLEDLILKLQNDLEEVSEIGNKVAVQIAVLETKVESIESKIEAKP